MIWLTTKLFTVMLNEETGLGVTHYRPVIKWANKLEDGPRFRRRKRAQHWAAQRICSEVNKAVIELIELEGDDIISW